MPLKGQAPVLSHTTNILQSSEHTRVACGRGAYGQARLGARRGSSAHSIMTFCLCRLCVLSASLAIHTRVTEADPTLWVSA